MKNEGPVTNNYTIMKPELRQINDIIINNVNNYNTRFEYYKIVCEWKLVFDNDIYIDVKSKVMSRIPVLCHNLEKYSKNKINLYEKQGVEFSHISEMNSTFTTSLDHLTHKHCIEQPMPLVEMLVSRKLYKNYGLIKTLNDIDLTLHMEAHETGKADIHYSSEENE